jgi:hypothetical protein
MAYFNKLGMVHMFIVKSFEELKSSMTPKVAENGGILYLEVYDRRGMMIKRISMVSASEVW